MKHASEGSAAPTRSTGAVFRKFKRRTPGPFRCYAYRRGSRTRSRPFPGQPSLEHFAQTGLRHKNNEHLSLGDLGLDTFNFNGHKTTFDALCAGLPVLTKLGDNFVARVSSSLLTSIGMKELITYDENQYEETALRIASNHDEIFKLKSKLEKLKNKSSLFNSNLYTQDLEIIYMNLVKNNQN